MSISNAPPTPFQARLAALRGCAHRVAAATTAPYSGVPAGASLLLSDGRWIGAARFESGVFPLTIPALQAAFVAAVGAGRRDVVAAASSTPLRAGEWEWLGAGLGLLSPGTLAGVDVVVFADDLPEVRDRLAITLDASPPASDAEGVALARGVASRAHAPFSDFPVGCVLLYETEDGSAHLVPGVNVEHPDWTRGLCAERSAIAAARSLGAGRVRRAYLSCLKDSEGTPCGACRQILVEVMPDATLSMDRGGDAPERCTPRSLLPDFFGGEQLRR
jgi:cytidine deaminase